MDPIIGGALIGGAANLLGNWMGSSQQNRNIERTNRANIDLANLRYEHDTSMANRAFSHNQRLQEYAYDKDMEMWKMQNQYNSPEQQMQRFEDAGLNKHMIYGQGSPGNATSMPTMGAAQYTPPSYQPPNVDYRGTQSPTGNVLGSFMGASKDMVQLKYAKETLAQNRIKTDIDKATQNATTDRIKHESEAAWFNRAIKNIEYTMNRYGVQNSADMYKILVRHMVEEQMSESTIRKALSGVAVGKELAEILKIFGIGHLIGRGAKKTQVNETIGTKNINIIK